MGWLDTIISAASGFGKGVLNNAQNKTSFSTPQTNNSVSNIFQNAGQGTSSPAPIAATRGGDSALRLLQGSGSGSGLTLSPLTDTGSVAAERDTRPVPDAAAEAAAAAARAEADRVARERAQAQRDLSSQQASLSGAEIGRNTERNSLGSRLQEILGRYGSETARNEADYNAQTDANTGNYNRDTQVALLNAARGRQGLFGTLSALGALSGSGIDLADRAVQQGANLELAGANETFSDNATTLTRAIEDYRNRDKERVADANSQYNSLNQTSENNYLIQQREIFTKMANLYNVLGDQAQADNYIRQANALAERIGATQSAPVGQISAGTAAYSPEALGSFMSPGANDVTVAQGQPGANNLLPSLMATLRRREQGV